MTPKSTPLRLRGEILVNALQDANFRAELITDPNTAVENKFGNTDFNIRIHDESPSEFVLMIPSCSADVEEQVNQQITDFENSNNPPTRGQLECIFIRKAWNDSSYLQSLKNDPRTAFDSELEPYGASMPSDIEIKVMEEMPGECLVVLPANLGGRNSGELTEAELESVAGGAIPVAWIVGVTVSEVGKVTVGSTVGSTTGAVVAVKVSTSTSLDSDGTAKTEYDERDTDGKGLA